MKLFGTLVFLCGCLSADPPVTDKCWKQCFVADTRNPSVCVAACEAEAEAEAEAGSRP